MEASQKSQNAPLKNRSTFTRRIMEARDVIERRSLNILYLYRPGRERAESRRKGGRKSRKAKAKRNKNKQQAYTHSNTQVSVTLMNRKHTETKCRSLTLSTLLYFIVLFTILFYIHFLLRGHKKRTFSLRRVKGISSPSFQSSATNLSVDWCSSVATLSFRGSMFFINHSSAL